MNLKTLYVLPLAATLFLTGCGGDPSGGDPSVGDPSGGDPIDIAGSGTGSTEITDAASDKFSQVWVDIEKITAVHKDTGAVTELTEGATQGSFDLLSLRDVSERLATVKLTEGEYTDVKITLTPGSKITVFDLQGEKKEVELASQVLPMTGSDFTIVKDGSTTLAIDFDVDQWETPLLTFDPTVNEKLPVDSLPVIKSPVVKSVIVKQTGVLEKEGADFFLKLPAQDFKYKLVFDENTDTTEFANASGSVFGVEGLLTNGELAVDEIESQTETEKEEQKIISEKIKIYGIVEFVTRDETTNEVTSAQVKVKRSSKILDSMSVNIILDAAKDGLSPVKYVNSQTGADALEAGTKVKVMGELLSTSMDDITAYTVVVKNGEIKPKVIREKFKSVEMVKCNSDMTTCSIMPGSSTNATKTISIDSNRLETNLATKKCFIDHPGEFIEVELEGRLSTDINKSTIFVKELESEQRCEDETTLVKGYISNYTDSTCSALDNDNAAVILAGKMAVVSFTNSTGDTVLFDEEDILFKISGHNGALKIKSDTSDENKTAVYSFLSLPEDAKKAGLVSVDNKVYVYADVNNIGVNHDAELTAKTVGGYVEITNAMGEAVVLRPYNQKDHRKSVACNFDLEDDSSNPVASFTTDANTRWIGKNYRFEDGREVKAVVDSSTSVAKSIRLKKLKPGLNEKETLKDLLNEDLTKGGSESDTDYGQRMIDFQEKLKDALKDALKGGLADEKIGEKKYSKKELTEQEREDKKIERENKYKEKYEKKEQKKRSKTFDFDEFIEDMDDISKDLYEKIDNSNGDIGDKSDVINRLSDELKEMAEKIERKMSYYNLPPTVPADIQELIESLGDISKLYDVFNRHHPFFDNNDKGGDFDDDKSDDEKTTTIISGDNLTVDGKKYTITFPTQAMAHEDGSFRDFTGWDLVKLIGGTTNTNKYYLSIEDDLYARTNTFELTGVEGDNIEIQSLEVITPELGSKIHYFGKDSAGEDLMTALSVYRYEETEDDGTTKGEYQHTIGVIYNHNTDNEVRYEYEIDEGMTLIETQLTADTRSIKIYNYDSRYDYMQDFYTDLTYQNEIQDIDIKRINLDVTMRQVHAPENDALTGQKALFENYEIVHGLATVDGKPYDVYANDYHIILEREEIDAQGNKVIDRMITQGKLEWEAISSILDENGKRDSNYNGVKDGADKQYMLNGIPLANWIYDVTDNAERNPYLIKRYGQNLAVLKLDTTDQTTPTNFYLNGREYPLAAITFTRIKERAGLLHVSPYSKKWPVDLDTGTEDIHQATEIVIDLQNGRSRTITDSITPKDKVAITENYAPVANADTATVDEDGSITIDVLANDTDADGDTLSIVSATATNGSVEITQ